MKPQGRPPGHVIAWSVKEMCALTDGIDAGLTDRQIADSIPGRTLTAVSNKRKKMGLKANRCVMHPMVGGNQHKPVEPNFGIPITPWPDMDFGPEINRCLPGEVTIDIRRTSSLKYAGLS